MRVLNEEKYNKYWINFSFAAWIRHHDKWHRTQGRVDFGLWFQLEYTLHGNHGMRWWEKRRDHTLKQPKPDSGLEVD